MKTKNIIFIFIAIIMSLFANVVRAETAPANFTVTSAEHSINTGYYICTDFSGIVAVHEKMADNRYAYCTTIHKTSATAPYTKGQELDDRYVYVLKNSSTIMSEFGTDKGYFTTALAIWHLAEPNDNIFSYFNSSNYAHFSNCNNSNDAEIAEKVGQLLTGAESYESPTPGIIINSSGSELTESGNYYVSSEMEVISATGLENSNYTVTFSNAPSGTIATDVNGTTKTTFEKNEKFIVKVPKTRIATRSIAFTVNVNATAIVEKAYEYVPSDSSYQSVAVLYKENEPVSASKALNMSTTTTVVISKKDITTGEEVPGAYLVIKNASGEVVEDWYSEGVSRSISLSPGIYTLTETIAPEGYVISEETREFTVEDDNTVKQVEMKNKPIIVTISKRHVTKANEVPGAHLVIKYENGEVAKDVKGNLLDWISDEEPRSFHLKPGTYILSETIAPDGYELSEEEIKFVVDENGKVFIKNQEIADNLIIFKNVPQAEQGPLGDVLIITAWLIGLSSIAYTTYYYRNNIKGILKKQK